jgi:uncharacterized protein (DUF2062 family)
MPALVSSMERRAALWLRQGISPRRLALTLALGFAIGCIPVVGLPTLVCALLALTLRLNLPAIQAANYIAMPLQLLLMVPFLRLGAWMFAAGSSPGTSAVDLLSLSPMAMAVQCAALTAHAVLAWMLLALPAVAVMTVTFIPLLRRVPALAENRTAG